MGDVKFGGAYVELFTKMDGFRKAMRSASESMTRVAQQMRSLGIKASLVGGAITGPILLAARGFAEFGHDIQNAADRMGMTAKAASELGYVAKMVDQDFSTFERSIKLMQKALNSTGSIKATTAVLAELGLTMDQLKGMAPEDQFTLIADRIGRIGNAGQKTAISLKLFGRSGTALIPLFNMGAAGIKAMRAEAERLGVSISDTTGATRFADATKRMKQSLLGLRNAIGAAVLPGLTKITQFLTGVIVKIKDFAKANPELIKTFLKIGGAISGVGVALIALSPLFTILGALSNMTLVGGALVAILGTVTALAGAVAGMAGLFSWISKKLQGVADTMGFGEQFTALRILVASVFQFISLKSSEVWLRFQNAALTACENIMLGVFKMITRITSYLESTPFGKNKTWGLGLTGKDVNDTIRRGREAEKNALAAQAKRSLGIKIAQVKTSAAGGGVSAAWENLMKRFEKLSFKGIEIPKLPTMTAETPEVPKIGVGGFFGWQSAREQMGGGNMDQQQLAEIRRQTSILQDIAENTDDMGATYA